MSIDAAARRFDTGAVRARAIPQPSQPLFGLLELRSFLQDPKAHMFAREAIFGPAYGQTFFGTKSVVLLGPDANELLFLNKDRTFANAPVWNEQIGRYFGGGLLLRDFEEHRAHRLLLQSAFTDKALESYVASMTDVVERHVDAWAKRWRRDFLAFPALKQLTLEVASRVFLGEPSARRVKALNRAFLDAVRASGPGNLNPLPIPGSTTWRGVRGRELLENYLGERIATKRASRDDDLFALLCRGETRASEGFTPNEIVDHLIFLLMAAHDTSTFTMTMLFYQLGRSPIWQERCRDEVLALGDGPITYAALDRLPLVNYAMMEALRMMPPLPFTSRTALADFEYAGVRVPAGMDVAIAPLHTHYMPSLWTNPETFDPLRFSPERAEHKRHRFGYVPFGGGVHKCLGMRFAELEIRLVMANALRAVEWSVPTDYVMPIDYTSLPVPADGLPVRLKARTRKRTR